MDKAIQGILIYNKRDYVCNNNKWFADKLIEEARLVGLEIKLLFTEEFKLVINGADFSIDISNNNFDYKDYKYNIKFAINRTRNFYISSHLEKMNITVFNTSKISKMCNNKALTHQEINGLGIKSIETFVESKESFFNLSNLNNLNYLEAVGNINKYIDFPYVVKSLDGHGGNDVYKVENQIELLNQIDYFVNTLKHDYFLIQKMSKNAGKDVRVYVIGNNIFQSVLRTNQNDFKSNYSLGGDCELYDLTYEEEKIIKKILEYTQFDFVGIDFILDENNKFLFNEIEDVVGCKMLYSNDIDILPSYVAYIKKYLDI